MDQRGIDIVDAISQAQKFRVGHDTALHKFQAKPCLSESMDPRQQSSLDGRHGFIVRQGERQRQTPFQAPPAR
jgi:hypothetical protein